MKTISFVIPIYNETPRLQKTFKALRELKLPAQLFLEKVIFVNDGSSDNSSSIVKNEAKKFKKSQNLDIKLVSYSKNKGKGYAVKTGLLSSNSEYTLFFDADMSTPLSELSKFVVDTEKGTDLIIGTRKNGKSTVVIHQPFIREFLGRCFTRLTNILLGTNTSDFTCGFKALSQKAVEAIATKMRINGWGYDAELIFLAERVGLTPKEVPVLWFNDPNSRVKIHKAIITTLKDLFTIRWEYSVKPAILYYPKQVSFTFSRLASIFA